MDRTEFASDMATAQALWNNATRAFRFRMFEGSVTRTLARGHRFRRILPLALRHADSAGMDYVLKGALIRHAPKARSEPDPNKWARLEPLIPGP